MHHFPLLARQAPHLHDELSDWGSRAQVIECNGAVAACRREQVGLGWVEAHARHAVCTPGKAAHRLRTLMVPHIHLPQRRTIKVKLILVAKPKKKREMG